MRELAQGRVVAFPRTKPAPRPDRGPAIKAFARGATAEVAAEKGRCSRREVFYLLKEERKAGRVRGWHRKGLSVPELARLFSTSEAWVRRELGDVRGTRDRADRTYR